MAQQPNIGEILVRAGVIDEYQLRSALGEQKRWGRRLGATLLQMGFVEERELVRALAEQLNLPLAQLEGKRIHQEVLDLVPADFAQKHMCLPLFVKQEAGRDTLYVGMEDPGNLEVFDDLCFRTGMKVKPVLVAPSELCEAIDRFYRGVTLEHSGELAGEPRATAPLEAALQETAPTEPSAEESAGQSAAGDEDSEEFTFVGEIPNPEGAAQKSSPDSRDPLGGSNSLISNRLILRALTQILIEKGVVARDELHARVKELADAEEI